MEPRVLKSLPLNKKKHNLNKPKQKNDTADKKTSIPRSQTGSVIYMTSISLKVCEHSLLLHPRAPTTQITLKCLLFTDAEETLRRGTNLYTAAAALGKGYAERSFTRVQMSMFS